MSSSGSSSSSYTTGSTSSAILESETETSGSRTVSTAPTPSPQPILNPQKSARTNTKNTVNTKVKSTPKGPRKPAKQASSSSSSLSTDSSSVAIKSADSSSSDSSSSSFDSSSKDDPKKKVVTKKAVPAAGKKSTQAGSKKGSAASGSKKGDNDESESGSTSIESDSKSSVSSSSSSSFGPNNRSIKSGRGSHYSASRGPHYGNSHHSTRQIRVVSDSSSSSSSAAGRKVGGAGAAGGSDSGSDVDEDDRIFNDEDDDDSDSDGAAGLPNVKPKSKNASSSVSEEEGSDVSGSEDDGEGGHTKKRKRSKSNANADLEMSAKKKGEFEEDDDDDDSKKGLQRPHKHKSGHKTDLNINEDEDDDEEEDDAVGKKKDKKDADAKKKKKEKDKKKRKRRKKHKRRKHKSLGHRILKKIKRFARFTKSSILCNTIAFFAAMYIITLVIFVALNLYLYRWFRKNDFKYCDIDVDRISRTFLDDLSKFNGLLTTYALRDLSAEAVENLISGDGTKFKKWYHDYFTWDEEWKTIIGFNIFGVYDKNHTCVYADYHLSDGLTQATTKEAPVPEYFNTSASIDLSNVAIASKGMDSDFCMVAVPRGTSTAMLLCHQPVKYNHEGSEIVGYMLMAADLYPHLERISQEVFGCVSIWADTENPTEDNKEALAHLSPGGILADGRWGGETYHKYYSGHKVGALANASGTQRVCTKVDKFPDSGNNVASFFLFPNRLPNHPPGPLVRVDNPAAMEKYGEKSVIELSVISVVIFLVLVVVIVVYLDIVVLRRITSLSKFLDGLSKDASKERHDMFENRRFVDDDMTKGSSKASRKEAPGVISGSTKRSQRNRRDSHSHSIMDDTESEEESTSTSTTNTNSTTSNSTSTTNSTTNSTTSTTASTTSTTASTSSRVNSVVSTESGVTTTTTNTTSGTSKTTTSTDSGDGDSSGNKHDGVWTVKKSMKNNVDVLKDDITTANISIRKERHWRRRCNHALRLMNLWCGRKDIFPGLRGKDKTASAAATEAGEDGTGSAVIKDDQGHGYEDMSVDDVLARPIAMEFLKVHSRFEESQENIFFLLDVTWLQELEKLEAVESDPVKKAQMHDTIVNVADHIVKRYIAQGAPQEINISSESMSIVRQLSGTYSRGMFAKAIYDVKMMTSMDVLSRFKHTPAFLAMSEALDVETYDMMSAAAKKNKDTDPQRKNSGNLASSGGGGVATGEIQVSAPSERGSADLRSDALGDSDDEDEDDLNEFEDDEDDNDNNSITNIDKPFRSTFRLMSAIADGAKPGAVGGASLTGSLFSSAGTDSSDSASVHSGTATPRSARGTKATAIALKESAGSEKKSGAESAGESHNENDDDDGKKKKKK